MILLLKKEGGTIIMKGRNFYFFIGYYWVMLFLAMQVRVMAACMESQIDKQEYTASAQSRGREGTGGINQPTIRCLCWWPYYIGALILAVYRITFVWSLIAKRLVLCKASQRAKITLKPNSVLVMKNREILWKTLSQALQRHLVMKQWGWMCSNKLAHVFFCLVPLKFLQTMDYVKCYELHMYRHCSKYSAPCAMHNLFLSLNDISDRLYVKKILHHPPRA